MDSHLVLKKCYAFASTSTSDGLIFSVLTMRCIQRRDMDGAVAVALDSNELSQLLVSFAGLGFLCSPHRLLELSSFSSRGVGRGWKPRDSWRQPFRDKSTLHSKSSYYIRENNLSKLE